MDPDGTDEARGRDERRRGRDETSEADHLETSPAMPPPGDLFTAIAPEEIISCVHEGVSTQYLTPASAVGGEKEFSDPFLDCSFVVRFLTAFRFFSHHVPLHGRS